MSPAARTILEIARRANSARGHARDYAASGDDYLASLWFAEARSYDIAADVAARTLFGRAMVVRW